MWRTVGECKIAIIEIMAVIQRPAILYSRIIMASGLDCVDHYRSAPIKKPFPFGEYLYSYDYYITSQTTSSLAGCAGCGLARESIFCLNWTDDGPICNKL